MGRLRPSSGLARKINPGAEDAPKADQSAKGSSSNEPHPEGCDCGECDAGTSRRSRSVIRAELEQLIRIHVRPEWQEIFR